MGFWSTLGDIGKFVIDPKNIGTAAGFAGGSMVGQPLLGASVGRAAGGLVSGDDRSVGGVLSDAVSGYGIGAGAQSADRLFASQGGAAAVDTVAPAADALAGGGPDFSSNVRAMGGAPVSNATLMASTPDSGMGALAPQSVSVLPEPGMTSLEKAFMISTIASAAGNLYGGFQENRRQKRQAKAGGDVFGRMLRDNMRAGY